MPGPATRNLDGRYLEVYTSESTSMIPGSFYIKDNIYDTRYVKKGNWQGKMPDYGKIGKYASEYEAISAGEPFFMKSPAMTEAPEQAFRAILKDAGASVSRDDVDKRIVKEIKTGRIAVFGSVTGLPGIIDSEDDVL